MANPCYDGPNPIKDDERFAIWKWAREHGGLGEHANYEAIANAINTHFFDGMAKPEWIDDIISGRKTPFRQIVNEKWTAQYNRRAVVNEAQQIQRVQNMGPVAKTLYRLWTAPRTVAVAGHGVVFPITHAGDLAFRPESWGTLVKGMLRTYRGAASSAYTERILNMTSRDPLYNYGLQSKVDMGPNSHPSGLISTTGGKTGFFKAAARAWDMLTVLRFELWKKAVTKWLDPEILAKVNNGEKLLPAEEAHITDVGSHLAEWANEATGSGRGFLTGKIGGEFLFGPKLTQSKLNRISTAPAQTFDTFQKMARGAETTAGERAVAFERLSGATQYLITKLGFLGLNAGVLYALGQKDKINFNDPIKGDFLHFKGGGITGNVPGLDTEIRTLAKILAVFHASRQEVQKQFRTTRKVGAVGDVLAGYGMGKLTPTLGRGLEFASGQNWQGRPLPWSKDPGTEKYPRLTPGELAASLGPIPTEGPAGYVYDQIRKNGGSALNASQITKALIIGGLGAPGFHVREDYYTK